MGAHAYLFVLVKWRLAGGKHLFVHAAKEYSMRSPLYCSGFLYRAGMHLRHGRNIGRKYKCISSFISPGDSVVDVGCGTGTLQSYLNGNRYLGIELNDDFISYARKKGREVIKQNALDFTRFSDFDVCVMMDVLHHVSPRHSELVEKAIKGVRKAVIISEPYDVPGQPSILKKVADMLDYDGINDADQWMNKPDLIKFYKSYDPEKIEEIGQTLIAVIKKSH